MPVEGWPEEDAPWDPSASTEQDTKLWQTGIDEAIAAGRLRLIQRAARDAYDLAGRCPRCDHPMHDDIHFIVVGLAETPVGSVRQNIICDCSGKHEGRPDGKHGCGWALNLQVTLLRPDASEQ
jgi:hypothetical protein